MGSANGAQPLPITPLDHGDDPGPAHTLKCLADVLATALAVSIAADRGDDERSIVNSHADRMHACHLDCSLMVISALIRIQPQWEVSPEIVTAKLYEVIATAIGNDPQWTAPSDPPTSSK